MDSQTYKYPNVPDISVTLILGEPRNIVSAREGVLSKKYQGLYKLMSKEKKEFINVFLNEGDMIMISYPATFTSGLVKITSLENKRYMRFTLSELPILYYYFGEFKIISNEFTGL